MPKLRYTPDKEIAVHPESAIRQLARHFGSHEAGLPEWVKNSADAYIREQVPREGRVIVLIFDYGRRSRPASIACLDFVGMSSQDIEDYFRQWADPQAAERGMGVTGLQGGHGHGGKAYMIQMFHDYAYLHTVRGDKGCKYGVPGGELVFGYIPTLEEGRGFPVPDPQRELGNALAELRVRFRDLPEAARASIAQGEGFTLVRGVGPKGYRNRIGLPHLIDRIVGDAQMTRTLQLCDVYVVVNGRLFNQGQPLALPEIIPMPGAEQPKEIVIPLALRDPISERMVSTTGEGRLAQGKLTLRTSDKSMRWKPRLFRHNIRFMARSDFVGDIEMTELGVASSYRDRMYGECLLDALEEYKQSDRRRLTESPLTRALNDWISRQVADYCRQFESRDRRVYDQKERDTLSQINAALDRWKNPLLEKMMRGAWGRDVEGARVRTSLSLPAGTPTRMELTASHSRAGVGVSIRPRVRFFGAAGNRVRGVPYEWVSSDSSVAFVDHDLSTINTLSTGIAHIHAQTLEGGLCSNSIALEVVDIQEIRIQPQQVELCSGGRHRFSAFCRLANGEQTTDIYLAWDVGNNAVARVSSAGLIYGFEPGETQVYAGDDRCLSEPAIATIMPAAGIEAANRRQLAYPRVLISNIDPDPQTGELVQFTSEHPPIVQRTIDVKRGIWWINSASPLARLYLDRGREYGCDSREWRMYHLERFIEIMARIRLSLDDRQGEGMSYDAWMEPWDETAARMQEQAASSLEGFIMGGRLPE